MVHFDTSTTVCINILYIFWSRIFPLTYLYSLLCLWQSSFLKKLDQMHISVEAWWLRITVVMVKVWHRMAGWWWLRIALFIWKIGTGWQVQFDLVWYYMVSMVHCPAGYKHLTNAWLIDRLIYIASWVIDLHCGLPCWVSASIASGHPLPSSSVCPTILPYSP